MTSFDLLELMWISTAGKTTSGVFLAVSKISLERKTHGFQLKIEKMKSFMSVLGVALAGNEVPGQNGWHVGCRVPARNPAFAFMDEGTEFSLFFNQKTSKSANFWCKRSITWKRWFIFHFFPSIWQWSCLSNPWFWRIWSWMWFQCCRDSVWGYLPMAKCCSACSRRDYEWW